MKKNELLKKYYEQTKNNNGVSSYTFYDVYEVSVGGYSSGSESCCGCCILLFCCAAILSGEM